MPPRRSRHPAAAAAARPGHVAATRLLGPGAAQPLVAAHGPDAAGPTPGSGDGKNDPAADVAAARDLARFFIAAAGPAALHHHAPPPPPPPPPPPQHTIHANRFGPASAPTLAARVSAVLATAAHPTTPRQAAARVLAEGNGPRARVRKANGKWHYPKLTLDTVMRAVEEEAAAGRARVLDQVDAGDDSDDGAWRPPAFFPARVADYAAAAGLGEEAGVTVAVSDDDEDATTITTAWDAAAAAAVPTLAAINADGDDNVHAASATAADVNTGNYNDVRAASAAAADVLAAVVGAVSGSATRRTSRARSTRLLTRPTPRRGGVGWVVAAGADDRRTDGSGDVAAVLAAAAAVGVHPAVVDRAVQRVH